MRISALEPSRPLSLVTCHNGARLIANSLPELCGLSAHLCGVASFIASGCFSQHLRAPSEGAGCHQKQNRCHPAG